ncbi:MAG: NAD-dependent epimerase/dehydratase family protein [Chloroflexota bacterium]
MKLLISGVTGRVGRSLAAAAIARGDQVRGLVLPGDPGAAGARAAGIEVIEGNLRDLECAREAVADMTAVAHLGAMMLWGDDDHNPTLFEDNLRGTFNLADAAARERVGRFVFASSDEVYPSLFARYLPIDENHPAHPYSFYGLTKLAGEETLRYYHRANGLPIAIARFALVAEPWETTRRGGWLGRFLFLEPMLPMIASRAGAEAAAAVVELSQGPDTLLLSRDAEGNAYVFHFCDVRDIVAGLLLLLEHPAAVGEAFNLSGPASFSFDTVVPYLAKKTGFPFVEAHIPGPAIRIEHSTAKARSRIGYVPRFDVFQSIEDGLASGGGA